MQNITLIETCGVWQRIERAGVNRTYPDCYIIPVKRNLAESIEVRVGNARVSDFIETLILTSAIAAFI